MCSRPEPMTHMSRIPGRLPPSGVRWERSQWSMAMTGQVVQRWARRESDRAREPLILAKETESDVLNKPDFSVARGFFRAFFHDLHTRVFGRFRRGGTTASNPFVSRRLRDAGGARAHTHARVPSRHDARLTAAHSPRGSARRISRGRERPRGSRRPDATRADPAPRRDPMSTLTGKLLAKTPARTTGTRRTRYARDGDDG